MGNLFGSSSSSKDYSINTDASNNLGNDAQLGTFAEDSYLSNLSGKNVISVLDGGVISGAFEFAESSNENINFLVGESLSNTEKITDKSFDAFTDVNKGANNLVADSINNLVDGVKNALSFAGDSQALAIGNSENITDKSFDAYGDVSQGANNLVADSINHLVDGFKVALNFAGDSQNQALKAVSETTSQQSSMYGQSLAAVQSGVSSSLTSGNTDIMKIVMLGLVGFGLVFALLGKK